MTLLTYNRYVDCFPTCVHEDWELDVDGKELMISTLVYPNDASRRIISATGHKDIVGITYTILSDEILDELLDRFGMKPLKLENKTFEYDQKEWGQEYKGDFQSPEPCRLCGGSGVRTMFHKPVVCDCRLGK